MNLNEPDRSKLEPTLDQLGRAIEDLLFTGLTTASEATRQTLNVAFQEASRLKLLRLGSTLRVANEELGRFTRNDPNFSPTRFSFFLNRAWLLARGLAQALKTDDNVSFDKLNWTLTSAPVKRLELVTLGVVKKVVANTFVAFDFRLRLVQSSGEMEAGQRIAWSCIFPIKSASEVPPEGYLHLPQKQRFKAFQLLEGRAILMENVAVAVDPFQLARISLGETSTVALGKEFTEWHRLQTWDPEAALERVRSHETGPFDLDVEMQEEVFFDEWTIGTPVEREHDHFLVYPIVSHGVAFSAEVPRDPEGSALQQHLTELATGKVRPPLFGLLHYEKCRLVLQPLTLFGQERPKHLMLSEEKIDQKALLKALNLIA